MNTTETYLYLISCALNKKPASAEHIDFDALWALAQGHNLTALTAKALAGTAAFKNADEAERFRWNNALNNNTKKTMLFGAELKKLLAFFEESRIWYLPLKGAVINGLYPTYGTREFADNDILIDAERCGDAKKYLLQHGYELRSDEFNSDEYSKQPFYNFEIHRTLAKKVPGREAAYDYYKDVKSRLLKNDGAGYGYRFSDDDFYIYFIFHAFKHYDGRGTGFRTVADEYVLLNSGKLKPDFARIERTLETLGLLEFERTLRGLASTLLSEPERQEQNLEQLTEDEREMLAFILSCSTFGSMDNMFQKEFERLSAGKNLTKRQYYLKRLFPPVSRYKYTNPFVYRHKIVYPFFLAYRLAVNPIRHRKYLKEEREAINRLEQQSKSGNNEN